MFLSSEASTSVGVSAADDVDTTSYTSFFVLIGILKVPQGDPANV